MNGQHYFLIGAALLVSLVFLRPNGDALVSDSGIRVLSAIQQQCKRHSREVAGVRIGCNSFADVRKIEMRADNRGRSKAGSQIVQIKP